MNLMKRENFGVLREAVHTNNVGDILGALIVSCRETGDLEGVVNYIDGAAAKAPYSSIATWSKDPATPELCKYLNDVNVSREPADLGNLAYLIMSSEWCDEWLAFAIDWLGHIDVGTVNLGDALHWWCGHWRVLHQRILDAGWECEPRHVWLVLSAMIEWERTCTSPFGKLSANHFSTFTSYPHGGGDWGVYESNHPFDFHSMNDWWLTVRNHRVGFSPKIDQAEGPFQQPTMKAQKIRGHK